MRRGNPLDQREGIFGLMISCVLGLVAVLALSFVVKGIAPAPVHLPQDKSSHQSWNGQEREQIK